MAAAFAVRKQKPIYQGSRCCVPGCKNRQGTDTVKRSYYKFPQGEANRHLRRLWEASVRRADWVPSNYDRICSDHFVGASLDRAFSQSPSAEHGSMPANLHERYGGVKNSEWSLPLGQQLPRRPSLDDRPMAY
ncbi:hypothetical protein Bbelb_078720 [Branchiostoma belcheri]|nr:hypothetical protein Bbelb_078720 [Branchiostoma belcheri]